MSPLITHLFSCETLPTDKPETEEELKLYGVSNIASVRDKPIPKPTMKVKPTRKNNKTAKKGQDRSSASKSKGDCGIVSVRDKFPLFRDVAKLTKRFLNVRVEQILLL